MHAARDAKYVYPCFGNEPPCSFSIIFFRHTDETIELTTVALVIKLQLLSKVMYEINI